MNPFLGAALVTGGAGLIGGLLGQQATKSSAQNSIRFQREMAQNKYQYLVDDLKAAGLNPILGMSGASAGPAGASAPVIPYMNPVGEAVSSAVDVYQAGKQGQQVDKNIEVATHQIIKMQEEMYLIASQAGTEGHKQALLSAQKSMVDLEKELVKGNTEKIAVEVAGLYEQLVDLKNQGAVSRTQFGRLMAFVKRATDALPGVGVLLGGRFGVGGPKGGGRGSLPSRFYENPYKMFP